jgi:hypothetical protein
MKRPPQAPAAVRVTAALIAVAFCSAGVAWGAMATMGWWAPLEFRLRAEWRDLIPGAIALWMVLVAFQFALGAIQPNELPLGVGQRARPVSVATFGLHLFTAALIGFMGFVLVTMSQSSADYFIYDVDGRRVGHGNPMWEWMRPVQRYSGFALILVAGLALVRRTRQFLAGRRTAAAPTP